VDKNIKSQRILTKLCALNSEYILDRTAKFRQKIFINNGVIQLREAAEQNLFVSLLSRFFYFASQYLWTRFADLCHSCAT